MSVKFPCGRSHKLMGGWTASFSLFLSLSAPIKFSIYITFMLTINLMFWKPTCDIMQSSRASHLARNYLVIIIIMPRNRQLSRHFCLVIWYFRDERVLDWWRWEFCDCLFYLLGIHIFICHWPCDAILSASTPWRISSHLLELSFLLSYTQLSQLLLVARKQTSSFFFSEFSVCFVAECFSVEKTNHQSATERHILWRQIKLLSWEEGKFDFV